MTRFCRSVGNYVAEGEPGQDCLWATWRSMPPGVGMSEQIMHAARRGRRGGNVQDAEEPAMAGSDAFTLETGPRMQGVCLTSENNFGIKRRHKAFLCSCWIYRDTSARRARVETLRRRVTIKPSDRCYLYNFSSRWHDRLSSTDNSRLLIKYRLFCHGRLSFDE